jgi:hypothetical protein
MLRILMLATVCCSTRCRSAVAGGQVRQCHRREALEKKIEKLFAEDPELAKELKAAAGLNALKAVNTARPLQQGERFHGQQQAAGGGLGAVQYPLDEYPDAVRCDDLEGRQAAISSGISTCWRIPPAPTRPRANATSPTGWPETAFCGRWAAI